MLGVAATCVGGGVAASGEGSVPAAPVLAVVSVVVLALLHLALGAMAGVIFVLGSLDTSNQDFVTRFYSAGVDIEKLKILEMFETHDEIPFKYSRFRFSTGRPLSP